MDAAGILQLQWALDPYLHFWTECQFLLVTKFGILLLPTLYILERKDLWICSRFTLTSIHQPHLHSLLKVVQCASAVPFTNYQ